MIYLYMNGTQRGPFSEEQVRAYARDGVVQMSDLAAKEPQGELRALSSLLESLPMAGPAPSPTPASPHPSLDLPSLPHLSLGPYARATLMPNESPFFRTSLHWIIFVRYCFLALLAFLFLAMPFAIAVQALTGSQIGWFVLPLPAFLLVAPAVAWGSNELVITNVRVLIKTGIIRRQTLEMFVARIESIAIDQGFLARFLDYGTVILRGTGGFEERFETIARPLEFRNWVQRMQARPSAELS